MSRRGPIAMPQIPSSEARDLERILNDLQDGFQRDIERAVRKRDINEAAMALGGKEACEAIKRRLSWRMQGEVFTHTVT